METNSKISTSKKPQWIECESKKNPGKKYLFNTTTGESKWLSSKNKEEPLIQVKKLLKSPANERLKRLQQNLRSEEKTKKDLNKTTTKTSSSPTKNNKTITTEKQKANATTASCLSPNQTEKTVLTPQARLKQKEVIAKTEKDSRKSPRNKKSNVEKIQILNLENKKQTDDDIKQKTLNKESFKISKRFKIPKTTEKFCLVNEKVVSPTQTTTTKTQNAVKKILMPKECLQTIKPTTEQKQLTSPKILRLEKSTKLEETVKKNLKSESKSTNKFQCSSADKHTRSTIHGFETPELKFLTNMPDHSSTPTTSLKRSANQRLERLRQKLQKQNKSIEEAHLSDHNSNIVTNSSNVSNVDLYSEEMDWEPSIEATGNFSFGSPAVHSEIFQEPTDMEVDDNLMLNAADQTFDTSIDSKWRPTYLYIVVDTNIFINQLSFIECLRNEKPMDAAGIILYLPYTVLQELDKLKLRENIKYNVQRAIRYLNKMFEAKDEHIQAQSALENRRHLIDIESSDDNILNCCLQVREHIPKVILLSEDINLRNKAICNNIDVFKKSDFMQKCLQNS